MGKGYRKGLKLPLGLTLALVLATCAEQGFPPGGPVDREPPTIVEAFPSADSTMVSLDTRIRIGFSERMDRESVEQSVFISPNPKTKPKFDWHRNELLISLPEALRANQTYVVTIGTGAKDVHNNRLGSSYTFAFSTGAGLDRGEIAGRVFYREKAVAGAYLWAYDLGRTPTPNPETNPPDYITQVDEEGGYHLHNLASGTYRLFAFLDRYKDGVYDVEEDPLGVPPSDVILTGERMEAVAGNLVLTVRDTTAPSLIIARARDNLHVLLRFDEDIQPLITSENFRVVAPAIQEGGKPSVRFAYLDPKDKSKCHLVTEVQEAGETYSVTVTKIKDSAGNEIDREANTATFFGSSKPDSLRPLVTSTSPMDSATGVPLDQKIEMTFSEAMDKSSVEEGFSLINGKNKRVKGGFLWSDPTSMSFVPARRLMGSSSYTARLEAEKATDIAGNGLADSSPSIFFTTLNPDTLGSISGTVSDEPPMDKGEVHIEARLLGRSAKAYRRSIKAPGRYLFDGVLPGKYFLSAFRDRDGDGRLSYGQAFPFVPAESFAIFPDTIKVRSRWETEGVDIHL